MKVLWAMQSSCNLKCRYCYFSVQGRKSIPFRSKSIPAVLKKLKSAKARQILVSGGEPLSTLCWRECLARLCKEGFDVVLTTNGILLSNTVVAEIVDMGVQGIIISLDSHKADYHDSVRGNYEETVAGIRRCVEIGSPLGLRIGVCCVVTSKNINYLPDMLRFVCRLGVDYFKFQPVHIPEQHCDSMSLRLTNADYRKIRLMLNELYGIGEASGILMPVRGKLEWVLKVLEEGGHSIKECWAGDKLIFLSENLEMFGCPPASLIQREENGISRSGTFVGMKTTCNQFSSDCACLWEVAYQDHFVINRNNQVAAE